MARVGETLTRELVQHRRDSTRWTRGARQGRHRGRGDHSDRRELRRQPTCGRREESGAALWSTVSSKEPCCFQGTLPDDASEARDDEHDDQR